MQAGRQAGLTRTCRVQDRLFKANKAMTTFNQMLYTNLFSAAISLTGETAQAAQTQMLLGMFSLRTYKPRLTLACLQDWCCRGSCSQLWHSSRGIPRLWQPSSHCLLLPQSVRLRACYSCSCLCCKLHGMPGQCGGVFVRLVDIAAGVVPLWYAQLVSSQWY